MVVVETDSTFEAPTPGCSRYLQLLEASGLSYVYVQPVGAMENVKDYTYIKGLQDDLQIQEMSPDTAASGASSTRTIFREDVAAVCVQSIMSLDWGINKILRVESTGDLPSTEDSSKKPVQQEWCVNSDIIAGTLNAL